MKIIHNRMLDEESVLSNDDADNEVSKIFLPQLTYHDVLTIQVKHSVRSQKAA